MVNERLWRLWAGFRIVPAAVKLRYGALIALGLGLLLVAVVMLPSRSGQYLGPVVALAMLGLGLPMSYALWCLLPDVQVGIAPALRGTLPCPPGQRVRLSFDDGPTPGLTDAVLDLLRQHNVQATFFLLTQKARRHPDLVRRIVAEGHTVGLHGDDHRLVLGESAAALTARLGQAQAELAAIAERPITLYRPSHGFKNRALLQALRRLGLRLVAWHFGVWDTDAPDPAVLLQRLRWATPRDADQSSPIVLLHDGRGDQANVPPHQDSLLQALAAWLPSARQPAGGDEHRL